jgi:hypothetical protein
VALGHDVSRSSAHTPEMKPEQRQEQAISSQRGISPQQELGFDIGLGL